MKEPGYEKISECRSCRGKDLLTAGQFPTSPIAGLYYDNNQADLSVCVPMNLVFCPGCRLFQLRETINPDVYRDFSFVGSYLPSYDEHMRDVALMLTRDWGIREKRVFEIGASNGSLLKYVAHAGDNIVTGVEPSVKLCDAAQASGIDVQQGYFNSSYIKEQDFALGFDCVIIRHVLEHIDDLNDMIGSIERILSPDGLLLVEVPDMKYLLENRQYSSIFHEHLNYFTRDSLDFLMNRHGFSPRFTRDVNIHGSSILTIYSRGLVQDSPMERESELSSREILGKARDFCTDACIYYENLHKKVVGMSESGMVLHGYGASHRTFVLLGLSGLDSAHIPVIYDKNPYLHGKRLNGMHSLVIPPGFEEIQKADAIFIFATSYENEIIQILQKEYCYRGKIFSVQDN